MKYLLDTSFIVHALKNHSEAARFSRTITSELVSSYVCLAELYEGVYRVSNPQFVAEKLEQFFTGLDEVFGIDTEISRRFGQIRSDLKRQGKVIEDMDILIAATCIVHNLTLVTFNTKHFSRIPDLKILSI